MKYIYIILIGLAINFAFTACNTEEPYSTAGPEDNPRILDPTFIDRINGELPVIATINRDNNFEMSLVVTPADFCTVSWLIDNDEVHTGKSINKKFKAGNYHLKVTVTTFAGKSTSREGILKVNPLENDPYTTEIDFERIISPGGKARLYGDNLDIIKSIVIDNHTIKDLNYNAEDNIIEYSVPKDLTEGSYRVILVDNGGLEYGGDLVNVFASPVIYSGAERSKPDNEWIMNGINLDKIADMTFAGYTISSFTELSEFKIAFICPNVEVGEYVLTGKTSDGTPVNFYTNKINTTEQNVVISAETVLWSGHHYVSWDYEDGNPNKTFNLISKETFASLKAGGTMYIYCSVEPDATYHQIRTTSGWWSDLNGTSATDLSQDEVIKIQLTQDVLDQINNEDGFLCVGHGYYVDKITVL